MDVMQHQEFVDELFGTVRCIKENGKIYFCGADIARALGYVKPQNAIATHTRAPYALKRGIGVETGKKADGTPAMQNVEMLFIPEGDVYRLIVRSKLPAAEEFERWVMDEILPAMRKDGGYVATDEMFLETYFGELDENLKTIIGATLAQMRKQRNQIDEQAQAIEEQKPAVEFTDAVNNSVGAISVNEFSKVLKKENKLDVGEHRLFAWLRRRGYVDKNNIPYQRYLQSGYFRVVERQSFDSRIEEYRTYRVTLVTGKGQVYLTKKLLEADPSEYATMNRSKEKQSLN